MTNKLAVFLTSLSTDDNLEQAFKKDPKTTMQKAGICQQHIDLVNNKDYTAIQKLLGADYSIAKNHVVKAYKK